MRVYMCVSMYINMCMYRCVFIYACVYIYIYIYIYIEVYMHYHQGELTARILLTIFTYPSARTGYDTRSIF